MHGLQTIKRLNTQAVHKHEAALAEGERVPDNGVANGLRKHSIGATYPAIVVVYGNGSYGVQYASIIVPASDNHTAQKIAERIADAHRSSGPAAALRLALSEESRFRSL